MIANNLIQLPIESIRQLNRMHTIGYGKLHLQLYKSEFEWKELKEVLQNWNIDKGSALIALVAKDIEGTGIEILLGSIRKKKVDTYSR